MSALISVVSLVVAYAMQNRGFEAAVRDQNRAFEMENHKRRRDECVSALSQVVGHGRVATNRFALLIRHVQQKDKVGWREDVLAYLQAYDEFRHATTVAHFLLDDEFRPLLEALSKAEYRKRHHVGPDENNATMAFAQSDKDNNMRKDLDAFSSQLGQLADLSRRKFGIKPSGVWDPFKPDNL